MSLTPREAFCSKAYKFVLVGADDAQWAGQHEYEESPFLPSLTGLEITPPVTPDAAVHSIPMKTLDEGDDLWRQPRCSAWVAVEDAVLTS